MHQNNSSYSVTNSKSILKFIFKWRKVLGIVFLSSIILSLTFSSKYFIQPKYESTTTLFPSSSNSVSKSLLATQFSASQDVLTFGLEQQAEHMLQILKSSRLKDKVVSKFNLIDHYKLRGKKFMYTKLDRSYNNNIRFKRNEYMAIEISVLDHDAQTAANIANYITATYDTIKNEIQKERALQAFHIVEREYEQQRLHIQKIEDTLTTIRKLGIHDYESQSEVLNNQLAQQISKGSNKKAITELEKKLDILAKYGSAYVSYTQALEFETEKLSVIKTKYDEAKVDATEVLPQKFVVEYASAAEKKAYPLRWLILITTTLSTLLLSIITIIIVERYNDWKAELKNKD